MWNILEEVIDSLLIEKNRELLFPNESDLLLSIPFIQPEKAVYKSSKQYYALCWFSSNSEDNLNSNIEVDKPLLVSFPKSFMADLNMRFEMDIELRKSFIVDSFLKLKVKVVRIGRKGKKYIIQRISKADTLNGSLKEIKRICGETEYVKILNTCVRSREQVSVKAYPKKKRNKH